jgi:CDP-6-deoxy-D-xylo-4-hexulose-3-dehydrase
MPNWLEIKKIADKYNLKILEDSADTIGCNYKGKLSNEYSDITITSFYGMHMINCAGNGGMLVTSNKKYEEVTKLLRSW